MMLSTDAGVPLWRACRWRPGPAQISGCVRVRTSEQDLATPRKTRTGQDAAPFAGTLHQDTRTPPSPATSYGLASPRNQPSEPGSGHKTSPSSATMTTRCSATRSRAPMVPSPQDHAASAGPGTTPAETDCSAQAAASPVPWRGTRSCPPGSRTRPSGNSPQRPANCFPRLRTMRSSTASNEEPSSAHPSPNTCPHDSPEAGSPSSETPPTCQPP